MRMLTIQTSPVLLDRPADRFRVPTRHALSRSDDFEEKFDFRTLFYDVFWSADGQEILCSGPPFQFGAAAEDLLQFIALPSGTACAYSFEDEERVAEDARSLIRIRPPAGTTGLEIVFAEQRHVVGIQPNLSALFAGEDVLLTISQDNALVWITDWINYHARNFSFRAVVLVDNQSNEYQLDQIRDAIQRHCDLTVCAVLSADFPYGPLGSKKVGGRADSNFLQIGMYRTLRHRMLTEARMVANFDVDELLVLRDRSKPLWELVEATQCAALLLPRFNTFAQLQPGTEPRHRMVDRIMPSRRSLPGKWIVRPRLLQPAALLHIHTVATRDKAALDPEGPLFLAHCIPITNGWNNPQRLAPDPAWIDDSRQDPDLRAHLDHAFDNQAPEQPWSEAMSRDSGYLCHLAAQAIRAGRPEEALGFTTRALTLTPDFLPALIQHARALRALGREAEAKAAAAEARRQRDENPVFHSLMASYELSRGRLPQATRWCELGLRHAPDDPELLALRATLSARATLPSSMTTDPLPEG